MAMARDFLIWLSTKPSLTRPIAKTGMRLGFARRFIAGETVEEALQVAQELNARGLLVVMNQLGEYVKSREEVEATYASYERLLREMAARTIAGRSRSSRPSWASSSRPISAASWHASSPRRRRPWARWSRSTWSTPR